VERLLSSAIRKDDNRCLQAALLIVLNALGYNRGWRFVNELSEYEDGLWTWFPTAAVAMNKIVPGTRVISNLDYVQFASRGEEFFREHNRDHPEWFNNQKEHASPGFKKEQSAAITLVASGQFQQRHLTAEDIEQLVIDHFVIAIVDSGRLAREGRSYAHSIVVYASEGGQFVLHDPGLPRRPALRVEKSAFMVAFKNELIAIPRV
jgi:hypothetical protein